MKVCCGNGKPYDSLTDFERLGGCSTDHCIGPIEVEDYLLETCGTFDTKTCIGYDDMKHLFKEKEKKE